MTTTAQEPDSEQVFVGQLRARFEEDGFDFQAHPSDEMLPGFLGRYRPDAIAIKGDQKIAIEIADRRTPHEGHSLREIRKLFDGHPDWQLRVVVRGTQAQEALTIPSSAPPAIHDRLARAQELRRDRKDRWLAFMSAWSLLEAAFRSTAQAHAGRPFEPGTVIQTLAMNGAISPELENRLRQLLDLRNRIVHGDLEAEPTEDQTEVVLSAVEHVLEGAA